MVLMMVRQLEKRTLQLPLLPPLLLFLSLLPPLLRT
jgi:hypothetical protein